jgi:putative nucleotidyltransferase-like protein
MPVSSSFETATGIRRRYVAAVVAREVLRDVAVLLGACSIPVMPLKGAFFQLFLYADPADRVLSDLDLLVPERRFEAAIQCLLGAGFHAVKAGRSLMEATLLSPRGFPVDVHRRLFSGGRYRLPTSAAFARSSEDTELLDVPLRLAHPLDTAAHLVGKFASDHVQADALARIEELALVARYYELKPELFVDHLGEVGMSRAAHYTFSFGAELIEDPFVDRMLHLLPRDALTRACVAAARISGERFGESSLAAGLSAHLLNASLPEAAASMAHSTLDRLRHAGLTRSSGRGGGALAPFFAK